MFLWGYSKTALHQIGNFGAEILQLFGFDRLYIHFGLQMGRALSKFSYLANLVSFHRDYRHGAVNLADVGIGSIIDWTDGSVFRTQVWIGYFLF